MLFHVAFFELLKLSLKSIFFLFHKVFWVLKNGHLFLSIFEKGIPTFKKNYRNSNCEHNALIFIFY